MKLSLVLHFYLVFLLTLRDRDLERRSTGDLDRLGERERVLLRGDLLLLRLRELLLDLDPLLQR